MEEDDLIPISALQHAFFCERQYALIHLEQQWKDNRYTTEGEILHERVDAGGRENRRLYRQEYSMQVKSSALGLVGKCDLVEIQLAPDGRVNEANPVEFKRGSKKPDDRDRIQLCAQTLCLEEMLGIFIPTGQFYYLSDHRRTSTDIDDALRNATKQVIDRIRQINTSGNTPLASYEARKCDSCSLVDICMPKNAGSGSKRVDRYMAVQLRIARNEANREETA